MVETSFHEKLVSDIEKLTKEKGELKHKIALKDKEIRNLRRELFGRSKESRKKRRTRANGR